MADTPYTNNLLTNPSCNNNDYAGWTKTDGGDSWGAWDNNWKSSYNLCSMEQTVDLLSSGFTEEQLDSSPYLFASGRFECPWDGPSFGEAQILVYLLNSSGDTLQTVTVKDTLYSTSTTGSIPWNTYTKELQLPAGTRKVKFYFAGRDSKDWGGQYGPAFDDMWLSLSNTEGIPSKNISCATVENGSFSVNKSVANYGDTIKIASTPAAGYGLKAFDVKTSDGAGISIAPDSSFVMPVGYDVVVSGTFWKTQGLQVSCATVENGSFSVNKTVANYGDIVKITATPAAGYALKTFDVKKSTGEAISVASDSSFVVPAECDVVVSGTFWKPFKITSNAPFFEGFEDGTSIQWEQQKAQQDEWNLKNTETSRNREPHDGSYNATLQYGNTTWLFTPILLEANTRYDFEMYARQDDPNSDYANILIALGNLAYDTAMKDTLVAKTNLTNGDYQKLTGSFTPTESKYYVLGIRGYINGIPWYISIDDIKMTVHEDPTTSIASHDTEGSAKVHAEGRMIVIENVSDGQKVMVFDVTGHCAADTFERNIQMSQAGIYIVKIGNEAHKVIVK